MRLIFAAIPLLLATGCATAPVADLEALCDATRADRAAHADALLADGGDASVSTGATLLARTDAACVHADAGQ